MHSTLLLKKVRFIYHFNKKTVKIESFLKYYRILKVTPR